MSKDDSASIIEKAIEIGRSPKDIASDLADDGVLNNSHLAGVGLSGLKGVKNALKVGDIDSVKEVVDYAAENGEQKWLNIPIRATTTSEN
ncbi:hypothetical protein CL614_02755 [archaeon]|nr:hypothetical protein [archaeon]